MAEFLTWFENTTWAWAAAFTACFFAFTKFALGLLSQDKKDSLSLWLMGAIEESWPRKFCEMFDAVFGEKHFSAQCMIRSCAASLAAVLLLWLLFGSPDMVERMGGSLGVTQVLLIGLAVNAIADFVSLYQTRWILGRMDKVTSIPAQVAILLIDLMISAAVILVFLYLYTWGTASDGFTFWMTLGAFSVWSVFFFSTFLTSVWVWCYMLSTWIVRVFVHGRLVDWLDVERRPGLILSVVLSLCLFPVAMLASAPFQRQGGSPTAFDDFICSMSGEACHRISTLMGDGEKSFEFLIRACVAKIAQDQCVERGIAQLAIEPAEAAKLFRVACDGGHAGGCTSLGYLYATGLGVPEDVVQAATLYRLGCDGQDALGCNNLGTVHLNGIGVAKSVPLAHLFFTLACGGGNGLSCSKLGYIHQEGLGELPQNADLAAVYYREGCDKGHAGGCTSLGYLYATGLGVPEDVVQAATLYRLGCEGQDALGCADLGALYERGLGVPEDIAQAVKLYRQSCDDGNATGCLNLGYLYFRGLGVAKDTAQAAAYSRLSCDKGHARGCSNLGVHFQHGLDVPQDATQAAKLYRKGCDGGDAFGCSSLGHLHENGLGVPKDAVKAVELFRQGCEGGDEQACAHTD